MLKILRTHVKIEELDFFCFLEREIDKTMQYFTQHQAWQSHEMVSVKNKIRIRKSHA